MLEIIKEVNPEARGFQELAKWNGKFVVISTVPDIGPTGAMFSIFTGHATSGEETMVFPSDENGNVTEWGELAVENGDDSRERCLSYLREDEVIDGEAEEIPAEIEETN